MMLKRMCAVLLLCLPVAPALAYGPTLALDGFYSHLDGDGSSSGYGGRLSARLLTDPDLFVAGQYQKNDLDGSADLRQWRAGFGMGAWTTESVFIYWQLEYVDLQAAGIDDRGGAAHLGLAASITPRISLYGRAGYLQLQDNAGPEFVGGLAGALTPLLGVFAEYRYTKLDSRDLNDIWAGLRLNF